jgi:hypothetical protein
LKICSTCKQEKDESEFHKMGDRGLNSQCKSCRRGSLVKNWISYMISKAKQRAKEKGYEYDIDKEYISELFEKQKRKCYWFGIEMIPSECINDPQSPTIDRLDNKKGYVKGNVVISCFAANIGRNKTNEKRFKKFVKELKK